MLVFPIHLHMSVSVKHTSLHFMWSQYYFFGVGINITAYYSEIRKSVPVIPTALGNTGVKLFDINSISLNANVRHPGSILIYVFVCFHLTQYCSMYWVQMHVSHVTFSCLYAHAGLAAVWRCKLSIQAVLSPEFLMRLSVTSLTCHLIPYF